MRKTFLFHLLEIPCHPLIERVEDGLITVVVSRTFVPALGDTNLQVNKFFPYSGLRFSRSGSATYDKSNYRFLYTGQLSN